MVRVWPQWWQAVGGPLDKMRDFGALVWLIPSRVITTSSALVRCRNLLGGPSAGSRRYKIHTVYRYIPSDLDLLSNVGVCQ